MNDVVNTKSEKNVSATRPKLNRIRFELTSFEGHQLLDELEHALAVVNRDTTIADKLWNLIANQLHGFTYDEISKELALREKEKNAANTGR